MLLFLTLSFVLLSGCTEDIRYGNQINSQNVMDASRTQNTIIDDIVLNAQPIFSMITNGEANTFTLSQLEGYLSQEMDRTQKAIQTLERYRQPNMVDQEVERTIMALSNYKSSLLFLREAVKKGQGHEEEMKQFITALNTLQSSRYIKP